MQRPHGCTLRGTIASEYRLQFNNRRLIVASLVKCKQPRKLPTAQR